MRRHLSDNVMDIQLSTYQDSRARGSRAPSPADAEVSRRSIRSCGALRHSIRSVARQETSPTAAPSGIAAPMTFGQCGIVLRGFVAPLRLRAISAQRSEGPTPAVGSAPLRTHPPGHFLEGLAKARGGASAIVTRLRRHDGTALDVDPRTKGPSVLGSRRSTPRRHHRPPRPRSLGPRDRDAAHLTRRKAQMRAKCAQIQPFARRLAPHVLGRTANHRLRSPRTRCASRDGGRGSALRGHSFLMSLVVSLSTSRPTRLSHRLLRATA